MRMPSDQTFLDYWTTWLATDAPRRLEEATVVEYKRQLVAFARWVEMPRAISSTPKSSTSQARVIHRPACVAALSPDATKNGERFGKYTINLAHLPDPVDYSTPVVSQVPLVDPDRSGMQASPE